MKLLLILVFGGFFLYLLCFVVGREHLCVPARNLLESAFQYNEPDFRQGIFEAELGSLQKTFEPLFAANTVSDYGFSPSGWQNITFDIQFRNGQHPEEVKPAVVIETRNFIKRHRGIVNDCIYCPVFEENTFTLSIACSPKARDEFLKLDFTIPQRTKKYVIDEEVEI